MNIVRQVFKLSIFLLMFAQLQASSMGNNAPSLETRTALLEKLAANQAAEQFLKKELLENELGLLSLDIGEQRAGKVLVEGAIQEHEHALREIYQESNSAKFRQIRVKKAGENFTHRIQKTEHTTTELKQNRLEEEAQKEKVRREKQAQAR